MNAQFDLYRVQRPSVGRFRVRHVADRATERHGKHMGLREKALTKLFKAPTS